MSTERLIRLWRKMTKDFKNYADAASQLVGKVADSSPRYVVQPIRKDDESANIVGRQLSTVLDCELILIPASVEESQLSTNLPEDLIGVSVLVADIGVETGQQARALASALRKAGVTSLELAVPICSKSVLGTLHLIFDEVHVLKTPLAPRSLSWHYEEMS